IVTNAFPAGTNNAKTTPIVLVFDETMQERSLQGAFDIVPLAGAGVPGQPIAGVEQVLVSDGRVLVFFPPPQGLAPGDYAVQLADQATALDLTGQRLEGEVGKQFGNFNVSDTAAPATPQ